MIVPNAWKDHDISPIDDPITVGSDVVYHSDPDDGLPHFGHVDEVDDDGQLVITVTATRQGEFPDGIGTDVIPPSHVVTVE